MVKHVREQYGRKSDLPRSMRPSEATFASWAKNTETQSLSDFYTVDNPLIRTHAGLPSQKHSCEQMLGCLWCSSVVVTNFKKITKLIFPSFSKFLSRYQKEQNVKRNRGKKFPLRKNPQKSLSAKTLEKVSLRETSKKYPCKKTSKRSLCKTSTTIGPQKLYLK